MVATGLALPNSSSRTVPVFCGWIKMLNVRASVSVRAPVPTDCSTQRGEAPAVSTATRVTLLTPSGETLGSSVKVSSVDPSGKMVFVWVTLGKGLAPYQGDWVDRPWPRQYRLVKGSPK